MARSRSNIALIGAAFSMALGLAAAGRPALAADAGKGDSGGAGSSPARPRPSVAPKVQDSYTLQPGDELSISVAPVKDYDAEVVVTPDGMLYLKGVGAIKAAGLTVDDLTQKIATALKSQLRNPIPNINITHLGHDLPTPHVTIGGAVAKPGPVDLEAGLRLRQALDVAGGPLKDGDLANVTILHSDLTRTVVDVSDTALAAKSAQNRVLDDGDAVNVPFKNIVHITVSGAVKNPGVIELEPDKDAHVLKLIDMAGGTPKEADLTAVSVVHPDLTRVTVDLSKPQFVTDAKHNLVLKDGDAVDVPLAKSGTVRISGAVSKPGVYDWRPRMTIEDLILAADKATLVSDLNNIQYVHEDTPKDIRHVDLEEQSTKGLEGRVFLDPGDEVFVPTVKDSIVVTGAVQIPGRAKITPGETLHDFLSQEDPLTAPIAAAVLDGRTIDVKHAKLIRQGEKAAITINLEGTLAAKPKNDFVLKNGDVLYLPPREFKQGSGGIVDILQRLSPLAYLITAL